MNSRPDEEEVTNLRKYRVSKPDETVGILAYKKFTSKENTSSMIQISSLLKVSIKDLVEYRIIDDVLEEVRMMSNDYSSIIIISIFASIADSPLIRISYSW